MKMFASGLALRGLTRCSLAPKFSAQVANQTRTYASPRVGLRRLRGEVKTAAETTQKRIGTAISLGQGFVAGGAALGLGALCYYGLGLSKETGAVDRAVFWSDTVKSRIKTTYGYFGASLAFTASTAVAIARNPALISIVSRGGWISLIVSLAAMWGTGIWCRSLPYQEGFGMKQLAWLVHSAVIGAVIAPITFLGGALLTRAAVYTAGMVGGLSMVAMCAPSEKFLNMGGPLAMGFGVIFLASIGTMFLPPTTAMGAGVYSVAVYGGLVLFGMLLLYDTQKIIKRAEQTPAYGAQAYDPVNNAISIYMDTVNIFIRIAMILAGNNKKK